MGYIATTGVTYISGTAGGVETTPQYVGSGDVSTGNNAPESAYTYHALSGSVPTILFTDPPLAYGHYGSPLVGSTSDRAPNLPSGYNALGVATYGSGKQNTTTTWGTDKSKLDVAATYFTGASGQSVDYDGFSS